MRVFPVHEAAHLAAQPSDSQSLDVVLPSERIHRVHDVCDRLVSVKVGVGCECLARSISKIRIGDLYEGG